MADNAFAGFDAVTIKTAAIMSLSTKRAADIRQLITHMEIYSSIFSPVTTGFIKFQDTTNALQKLPVLGEEILELEFASPDRKPFKRSFFVSGIQDKTFGDNGSLTGGTLVVSSVEHYQASMRQISKGSTSLVSAFVTDILKSDLKTERPIYAEETRGQEKIIIPNKGAWEAIEGLRKRAVSNEYSSPYLFFEDNDGYHFLSYEKLIELRERLADEYIFDNDPYKPGAAEDPGQNAVMPKQYRTVMQFEIITKNNNLEAVSTGGISNQQVLFDPFTKTTKTVRNNYADLSELVKKPLSDKFYPDKSKLFSKAGGVDSGPLKVCLVNSTESYYQQQETEGVKQLFASAFSSFVIGFTLYGDSQLQPGDVVMFRGPSLADANTSDGQITGKYIIGNLRHGIEGSALYTTVEAYRFGSGEKVVEDDAPEVSDAGSIETSNMRVEVLTPPSIQDISPIDSTTLSSIELLGPVADETRSQSNGLAGLVSDLKASGVVEFTRNVRGLTESLTSQIQGIEARVNQISYGTSLPFNIQTYLPALNNIAGPGAMSRFEQIKSQYQRIQSVSNGLTGAGNESLFSLHSINTISASIPTDLPIGADMSTYRNMLSGHVNTLQQYVGKAQSGYAQMENAKRKIKGLLG